MAFLSDFEMKDPGNWLMAGLMSGSSLDGLDVALCAFEEKFGDKWEGQILEAATFTFPTDLRQNLKNSAAQSALELAQTEVDFVSFSADCVNKLIQKSGQSFLAIASHGHTVFHQPSRGFTLQIGNGGLLAAKTGLPVISDFRTTDVGKGGQGAPLVPGAEHFLFSTFAACLNLGGIANISFPAKEGQPGIDLGPCNQLLNYVADFLGVSFDAEGKIAASGKPINELIDALNQISYYQLPAPKSLGNEDVREIWLPFLQPFLNHPADVLHSLCLHIGMQICRQIPQNLSGKILVTGGGVFHTFLLQQIENHLPEKMSLHIPSRQMIEFKEAFCFAFLGLKRWRNEVNCFASQTGASRDSCLGAVYLP